MPSNLSMLGDATDSSCNKLNLPTIVLGTEDLLPPEVFLRYTKAGSLCRSLRVVILRLTKYMPLQKLYCNEIKKKFSQNAIFSAKRMTKNVQGTERVQSCIE
jgi:hypothetical protein